MEWLEWLKSSIIIVFLTVILGFLILCTSNVWIALFTKKKEEKNEAF